MKTFFHDLLYRTFVMSLVLIAVSFSSAAQDAPPSEQEDCTVPPLYGIIFEKTENEDMKAKGLYRIPRNDNEDPTLIFNGFDKCIGKHLYSAGVYINGVYYLSYCEASDPDEWGHSHTSDYIPAYYGGIYAVDMRNGSVYHWECPRMSDNDRYANATGCTTTMAYDKTSGDVYAIGFGKDLDERRFQKMRLTINGPSVTKTITTSDNPNYNSLYELGCSSDGQLYDLSSYLNSFFSVDKATGKRTKLGNIGMTTGSSSGSACLYGENYYLNYKRYDKRYIYTFNVNTLELKCLYQLKDDAKFSTIFVADDLFADDVPAECVVEEGNGSLSMSAGSLHGKVSLTAPACLWGGDSGSGPLTVTIMANNTIVGSAQAEWGKPLEIDLYVPAPGWYNIKALASNEAGSGIPVEVAHHVFIGGDTPFAPKPYLSYIGSKLELTWQPVTESENNGYLDLNDMSYSVRTRSGETVAENIKDCAFTISANMPHITGDHQYEVYAKCGGVSSQAGVSNPVDSDCIVTPYEPDFDDPGSAQGWSFVNVNGDNRYWFVDGSDLHFGVFLPSMSSVSYCNDWAITPAISMQKGMNYTFSCNASYVYGVPRLDVNLCTVPNPEAKIISVCTYQPTEGPESKVENHPVTKSFSVNEDGYYYIGLELTGSTGSYDITDFKLVSDPTGIDMAEEDQEEVIIVTEERQIRILNAEGIGVTVNGIDGTTIFNGVGTADTIIPAAPGLHIVKAGSRTAKVIVR